MNDVAIRELTDFEIDTVVGGISITWAIEKIDQILSAINGVVEAIREISEKEVEYDYYCEKEYYENGVLKREICRMTGSVTNGS